MSMYTMVDGFFVSRFVGADALSAINIVYPLIGLVVGMGIMLGTGGSAVIARGEKELHKDSCIRADSWNPFYHCQHGFSGAAAETSGLQ